MASKTTSLFGSKWARVVLGVIGVTLFGLGVRGIWVRTQRNIKMAIPANPMIESLKKVELARSLQTRKDHLTLKEPSPPPMDLFGALIRLGQQKDPEARAFALKLVSSPNPQIRSAVANCLGNYDDETSLSNLQNLLKDPDRDVVLQAIDALGHRHGPDRVNVLTKLNQNSKPAPELRLHIASALYRAAETDEVRSRAIQELLALARSHTIRPSLVRTAVLNAAALAPRDSRVVSLLQDLINTHKDPTLTPGFIRQLGVIGDPWIRKNIKTLVLSGPLQDREAGIEILHSVCPKNRFELLHQVLTSKHLPSDLADDAVRELTYMPSDRARKILQDYQNSLSPEDARRKVTQDALSNLTHTGIQDPCLR